MQNNQRRIIGDELLTKNPIELKGTLSCVDSSWATTASLTFFFHFSQFLYMLVALCTIDAHCGGDKLAAADRRLG